MNMQVFFSLLNRKNNYIITNPKYVLVILILLTSVNTFAQVGIGTDNPAASAALEVSSSSNNKGILIPRITAAQKDAISNPAEGLMIYQTSAPSGFYYYSGTGWKLMITQTNIDSKVDKVGGKELSSNDYTTAEKTKLAAITGTNTGDQTTITGNSGTATKLATPRNINGVAFDGTTDITVTAAAGTLTGATLNSTVTGSSLTSVGRLVSLDVNGAATNTTAFNAAASTTIDFTKSNLAYTSNNPGSFILSGIKDGGSYSLAVQGTTIGTSAFSSGGFTFMSVNNGPTTSGKQTLYTFIVMGTTVYFFMVAGF
jgi:hypothetical protein